MWIERKSCIHGCTGLVQLPYPREYGREIEMRDGIIPVCVEPAAHPDDRFGIGTELCLRKADPYHPSRTQVVARRKAERLVDVRFGFCASTKEILGEADESMSAC